jgi:EmrB/QacA subfamily drug resistance transporter
MDARETMNIDAPGVEEVAVVAWPLLFRAKAASRIEASDRYRWWVLWTALSGLFAVGLTVTILGVSLERIAHDLHSNVPTVTWVVTGPLLAFGVVGPLLGKVGDIWGYRRVFLLGLAGSIVLAGLSAAAWSASSLIVFRIMAAAEGAATGPASMAMIARVFPESERVKAMGFWSMVGAGAPVLGVAIGGPLVDALGWRAIFLAQMPFTLLALTFAFFVLPATGGGTRQPIDGWGVAWLSLAVTGALFGLNRGPVWGWTSPSVVIPLAVSPVSLVAFVITERRARSPLIPLAWFGRRNFSFPVAVQFFSNFAYMGSFILAPLFMQNVLGYSITRAGLVTIARPIAFSITAPVAGYLAVRLGERSAGITGALLVVASMAAWSGVGARAGAMQLIGALALAGVGLGVASPSMVATVANTVEEASLGAAGAANQLITTIGVVAGIQVAETVQASRGGRLAVSLVGSFHDAFWVLGAISLIGVVCALFVRSSARDDSRERSLTLAAGMEAA